MNDGKVLIVAICSNHKDRPGYGHYDGSRSLLRHLAGRERSKLLESRRTALDLLKGAAQRNGTIVGEHEYNSMLTKDGPDFGGSHPAMDYLPAIQRYTGRFYGPDGLSADGADAFDLVRTSPHHFLIISGLYGVVAGDEYIQRYSLTLGDHPKIRTLWSAQGFLTTVILAYMRAFGIERVYDLTGSEEYRSLLWWSALADQAPLGLLHAFSKRNAGPACLPALGKIAQELLQSDEEELLTRPSGFVSDAAGEPVLFTEDRVPPYGYPREEGWPVPDECPEAILGCARRDEPVEVTGSGDHGTIFGTTVRSLADLPPKARQILEPIALMPEVGRIVLGAFSAGGSTPASYDLLLTEPVADSGVVKGSLRGPGRIGNRQSLSIRVQPGCERAVLSKIRRCVPGTQVRYR